MADSKQSCACWLLYRNSHVVGVAIASEERARELLKEKRDTLKGDFPDMSDSTFDNLNIYRIVPTKILQ